MKLLAKLIIIFFINTSIAKCQQREVYLSQDYFKNGIKRNALFKLDGFRTKFVLIPCFSKGSTFNIDSIEYFGNMWPRIRVNNGVKLASILFKPIKKLIRYQQVLSKINDCATSDPDLIIYIRENQIIYTIRIKNWGKCLNQTYHKKAAKWIKLVDESIQVLNHSAPG